MELKDLANKFGVVNIVVSHINSDYYKDSITVVISNDLVMNYVGKTYSFVPLTENGINKQISSASVGKVLDAVKAELNGKSF